MLPIAPLKDYDEAQRQMIEFDVYDYMGSHVENSIQILIDEGFTREEAAFFLVSLTALQMHRTGWKWGPVQYYTLQEVTPFIGTR